MIRYKNKKIIKFICCLLLASFIFIVLMYLRGYKLYIFKLQPVLLIIILVISIIGISIVIINKNNKGLKIVFKVSLIVAIVVCSRIYGLLYSEIKYFEFTSKDYGNTLVIEETASLLYGRCNIYEKKYGIFLKGMNEFIMTDDGYRPFSNEEYSIEWIDKNKVKIRYLFDGGEVWKYEIINIK